MLDPNVAAAVGASMIALIGVLSTAVFVAIRRNGNGSQQQQRGNDILELFRQSTVSLTQLASNQSQIVATQSEIVHGQDRIVQQMSSLVQIHTKMEGSLDVLDRLVEERRRPE